MKIVITGLSALKAESRKNNPSNNVNLCFIIHQNINSNTFILEKEIAWEPAGEGVVRQIMGYDGQVMLVKVKFEQGAIGTPHTHYHTQTTYVASGKFEFTVNGEKQIVETGDGVYIEPDAEHGCVCLEAGILIDCFSPMRADFLKR